MNFESIRAKNSEFLLPLESLERSLLFGWNNKLLCEKQECQVGNIRNVEALIAHLQLVLDRNNFT